MYTHIYMGFPGGSDGKEAGLQCRKSGFDPWVGKIPWRRAWQPTPVFLPRVFHGPYRPWGHKESDTTEQLRFHFSLSCVGEGNGNPLQWFLPGESQGQRSLVGRLWGHTESDMTEAT